MFQKGVGYHAWVCYNVFRRNLNQLIVYIVYTKKKERKILL